MARFLLARVAHPNAVGQKPPAGARMAVDGAGAEGISGPESVTGMAGLPPPWHTPVYVRHAGGQDDVGPERRHERVQP